MPEEKDFEKILDKAKELENTNFSVDADFDYRGYYSVLEKIAAKNNNARNEEAENIVKEQEKELIDNSFIDELNKRRRTVEDFIRKYDPNKDDVKNLDVHDVDKVYAIANYLLNSYIQYVNEMKFIFSLTKQEYKFLNKILTGEIGYNGEEVFNYTELYNNFWKGVQEKFREDASVEGLTFSVDIKMLLILHHLIKEHKVKGRTNDFIMFQSVLYKIARINKLFNAYNIIIERIKSDRELWGNALDEIMKEKDPEYKQQLEEMKKKQGGLPGLKVMEVTDEDLGK